MTDTTATILEFPQQREQPVHLQPIIDWCDSCLEGINVLKTRYAYRAPNKASDRLAATFSLMALASQLVELSRLIVDVQAVLEHDGDVDEELLDDTIGDLMRRATMTFHGAIFSIRAFVETYHEAELQRDRITVEELLPPPQFTMIIEGDDDLDIDPSQLN